MPRGIPNAKRDDTGIKYTTFHVPLATNPKHLGSTYLKSESQTIWHRNAQRKTKAPQEEPAAPEQRRGSQVIVIHPGSRFTRIGKASDVTPVSIPTVIARKTKPPVPEPTFVEGISRSRKGKRNARVAEQRQGRDEYEVVVSSDDPFEEKIGAITVSLRDRMRFYKLRVSRNAANIASTYNDSLKPEIIAEHNDPYRVDWIDGPSANEDVLVGEKVLRIADPQASNYMVRWPIYGSNFNTRDYPSLQFILSDIEILLRTALKENLGIESSDYQKYSVVLIIPDFWNRSYVRELVRMLLVSMGFKQLCTQQESLAATYGAGISNACVVDVGAKKTSIACVDEGLVIADTRISLSVGGDDITEFLYVLLDRICFPYRDIDLAKSYDWNVMEDLKARMCTLLEVDVALNLYDFIVRKPGQPAEKYSIRAYDEIILAPMSVFEPRVIEFDRKRAGMSNFSHSGVTEEVLEQHPNDQATQAMAISTQHLIPASVPTEHSPDQQDDSAQMQDTSGPNGELRPVLKEDSSGVSMDVIDVDDESKPIAPSQKQGQQNPSKGARGQSGEPQAQPSPEDFGIDVCFEASKLPLDVAIFNSARAAGGDEKIRKYLQAVLVIGGTARISGVAHALESRLQAIATPLVQNMEKVQIIPPPKDVDPRVLVWKGGAVLGKMDGCSELWVTQNDWDVMGMRGLKERCFFI